jgi:MGT family glycosyltransferase
MHHLVNVFKGIARRSGYALRENKTWWFGEMGPRLVLPEIVLCPRAFQFPEAPHDERRYVANFVDLERNEEPLSPSLPHNQTPLVYCSLGSSAFFYPHARRFFAAVIGVSRSRPEWQFVLHTGDVEGIERLGAPPSNLLIRKQVPQLALLAKAAVMVTHGGLNSIMECIHFEVPMVIVPAMRDQPGNAARARYHGIGLIARMSSISAGKLITLITSAMESREIRLNLARLKLQIAAEAGIEDCVQSIEASAARDRSV